MLSYAEDLAIVREYAKATATKDIVSNVDSAVGNTLATSKVDIGLLSMYGTKTMSTSNLLNLTDVPILPTACTIETTVTFTVDYQNDYIVSAGTPSLEITSGTGVADWIEFVSCSTDINQQKKKANIDVTCKIKTEITLGTTTSWAKQTVNYTAYFKNIL